MLSGVSVTVYRLSGEEFHVKEDVYTSHLTTVSIREREREGGGGGGQRGRQRETWIEWKKKEGEGWDREGAESKRGGQRKTGRESS